MISRRQLQSAVSGIAVHILRKIHIQSHTACLQTDNQDLWSPRGLFEFCYCMSPLLHIHRSIKSEPGKVLALQGDLNEV